MKVMWMRVRVKLMMVKTHPPLPLFFCVLFPKSEIESESDGESEVGESEGGVDDDEDPPAPPPR